MIMARSIWKGAITFGLVSVPVELFPAEEKKEFKFSMLDKHDFSPVGYKRYSKETGKEVEWADIVKGYEYEKGQYVVLTDEDFKRANVKASRTIEIEAFVKRDEISPEYFEAPYYLVPAGGDKIYALLRETLRSTGRVAIAQFVLRTTQHLAAVMPEGRALMLYTMRYADELRGTGGFELPAQGLKEARVTAKEIGLAKKLIDDMTEKWNPAHFKDTYHQDLMARIKEKIKKGQTREITKPSADDAGEPRASNVIDLSALLKQSIGSRGRKRTAAPAPRPKPGAKPRLAVVAASKTRPAKAAAKRKQA
jgi:DNA end-binding protein Ku